MITNSPAYETLSIINDLKCKLESLQARQESILETIGSRFDPEEVFAEEALERWAESHGYIRPE